MPARRATESLCSLQKLVDPGRRTVVAQAAQAAQTPIRNTESGVKDREREKSVDLQGCRHPLIVREERGSKRRGPRRTVIGPAQ